jgi:hypothetical protein
MFDSFGRRARWLTFLALTICSVAACGSDKEGEGDDASVPLPDAGQDAQTPDARDAGRDGAVTPRVDASDETRCGSDSCALGQRCDRSFLTPRCVGSCDAVTCAAGLVCQIESEVGRCVAACTPGCGPGQRCEAGAAGASCVDNSCDSLRCGAEQACVAASQGSGFVCVDNRCASDIDCAEGQHCRTGLCVADVCTPGETTCAGQSVRECMPNGAGVIEQVACVSAAELVSECRAEADGAACSCRDDWDCPAHTECLQGRCAGTGRAPTCFLPPLPFNALLPRAEPGFPWGGDDLDGYDGSRNAVHGTPRSRDAAGHPFARHAQVSAVPVVANLDDDNGDGLVDELDMPEIVFTSFCDQNYHNHGVLRAVHGGGARAGSELFAVCESKIWREGDPLVDALGQPLEAASCDCARGELEPTGALAVGDLDGEDGVPEIVLLAHTATAGATDVPNHRVMIYRNTGELISDNEVGNIAGANPAVTIANLDGKGFAELTIGSVVLVLARNESDRLVVGKTLRGAKARGVSNGQGPVSCAADLTGDGRMEVVAGGTTYRVPVFPASCPADLTTADEDTKAYCEGRLPVLWDAAIEGFCAIADVLGAPPAGGTPELAPGLQSPLDGKPEVLVVSNGRLRVYDAATCGGANGTGCVARVDVLLAAQDGGPPNVDDFDGDGFPEVGIAFMTAYVVYDFQAPTTACSAWPMPLGGDPSAAEPAAPVSGNAERTPPALGCATAADCGDATQFTCSKQGQCVCLHNGWRSTTQDASSRVTGSSVFDFNGDGAAEVVYNDECYFRIYDGKQGRVYQRLDSQSPTRIEYPVVADVDSDGNAEIVFSGSNARSENCVHHDAETFVNGVQVIGDPGDRWVAARRIWNQHAYHVTNVLESGAIPLHEVASWKSYGGRAYNTYRSNLPPYGNVAPDLTVEALQLSSPGVECGEALSRDLRMVARVVNKGDLRVGAGVLVRFVDQAGVELGMQQLGAPLLPGGETFVTLAYRAPSAELLPSKIRAVIDPDNVERECNDLNNEREVEVKPAPSAPELRIVVQSASATCPSRSLSVQVVNDGAQPVASVDVGFYAGNPAAGAKLLKTITIRDVPGNAASLPVDVLLAVGRLDVTVYAVVDPDNAVVECNDGNNLALVDVLCQPIPI